MIPYQYYQYRIVRIAALIVVLHSEQKRFDIQIRNDSWPSAFDRVRRYGSMRGQELADTVARMAGITVSWITE